jgi:hypothetical protein
MINPKRLRTLGASIAGLSLAFMGLTALPQTASAQIDRLDHFRCY